MSSDSPTLDGANDPAFPNVRTPPGFAEGSLMCAVCYRVLSVHDDGRAVHSEHVEDHDHPPVPVPVGTVAPIGRCDFCSADHPGRELHLSSDIFVVPVSSAGAPPLQTHGLDRVWSCCQGCADLIDTGRWKDLLRRARRAAEVPGTNDPGLDAHTTALFRTIRKVAILPTRPIGATTKDT